MFDFSLDFRKLVRYNASIRTSVPNGHSDERKGFAMRGQRRLDQMTEREYRAFQRERRARRRLQCRLLQALFSLCLILVIAGSFHGIRSSASTGEDVVLYKYYTQVYVPYGETLDSLADAYIDYSRYEDKDAYVSEVMHINHLTDADAIRTGQSLILPYYSAEFVQ